MADLEDKDQKTEEATPRRIEEARERGQVAISTELVAALGLCSGLAGLALASGGLWRTVGSLIVDTAARLPDMATSELTVPSSAAWIEGSLSRVLAPLAVFVLPVLLVSLLAGYGQVGLRLAPKAVHLDPSKIDPVKGLGRLFGLRSVVRTGLAALKVVLISAVMAAIAWHQLPGVVSLGGNELGPLLVGLGVVALRCTGGALVAVLALAVLDLLYQRHQHRRDLRMSKHELKEEHRLTEGDPHVRARVRQIQREMATRRMMADVPRATVVVTNPTHYAVALRYERDEDHGRAPTVVAKGAGPIAQRIKTVAAEADVVRYEDVALARALYRQVEVGQEIPEELYAAVAAVLAYVYRLREGAAVPA